MSNPWQRARSPSSAQASRRHPSTESTYPPLLSTISESFAHSIVMIHTVDTSEDRESAKRRKVRKGTQSCWECKRRKVRCIFAALTNTFCDNCMRRGTTCISQEYPDTIGQEAPERRKETGMEARLCKVEDMLQQLVEEASMTRHHSSTRLLDSNHPGYGLATERLQESAHTSHANISEVRNI
jgi:hypothetical protein